MTESLKFGAYWLMVSTTLYPNSGARAVVQLPLPRLVRSVLHKGRSS